MRVIVIVIVIVIVTIAMQSVAREFIITTA